MAAVPARHDPEFLLKRTHHPLCALPPLTPCAEAYFSFAASRDTIGRTLDALDRSRAAFTRAARTTSCHNAPLAAAYGDLDRLRAFHDRLCMLDERTYGLIRRPHAPAMAADALS